MKRCDILHKDYIEFLKNVERNSVDLILTDPPYGISRETGFKNLGGNSVSRLAVSMDFGDWDKAGIDINKLTSLSYDVIREGGTLIIWYDVWKLTLLATAMRVSGFKMLRIIMWNKTNPVPLNSRATYLTNCREIAVMGVKAGKPVFNSEYDDGIYEYCDDTVVYRAPIPRHGGNRVHPTQKPLHIFSDLVRKHTTENALVCDPFLGSGTTALAALYNYRNFIGCDIQKEYVETARDRVQHIIL